MAAAVVFLVLWAYFDRDELYQSLEKTYRGSELVAIVGHAKSDGHQGLSVSSDKDNPVSEIRLDHLDIRAAFYQQIELIFSKKPSQQSLYLHIETSNPRQLIEEPVLYTDMAVNTFSIERMLGPSQRDSTTITGLSIVTKKLTDTYGLQSVRFVPSASTKGAFFHLLSQDIRQLYSRDTFNKIVLVAPELLVTLYFFALLIIYSLLSIRIKYNRSLTWWLSLLVTWLVIDIGVVLNNFRQINASSLPPLDILNQQALSSIGLISSSWLLGVAAGLACLKRRYGYISLAVGSGYLFITFFAVVFAMLFGNQVNSHPLVVLLIECLFTAGLFYWLPAKVSPIEELRLEKAPTNSEYISTLIFLLMIALHVIIHTYFFHEELTTSPTSWIAMEAGGVSQQLINYLAVSQQQNIAVITLLWSGAVAALGFSVFGVLRYLGGALLPSAIAVYMLLSLPIWSSSVLINLGYETLLIVLGSALAVGLIAIVSQYRQMRLFILLLLTVIMLLLSRDFLSSAVGEQLSATAAEVNAPLILPHYSQPLITVFYWPNAYTMFPAVVGSLVALLLSRRRQHSTGAKVMLVLSTISLLFIVLAMLALLTEKQLITPLWLNTVVLLVATMGCFVGASVYQCTVRDEETLPDI